jgi:transaldolase
MTKVVADTGDLAAIRLYKPVDCTTNPSLVLAALSDDASDDLVARELAACRASGKGPEDAAATLSVAIGAELAALVPGRVSTEVDASLSFDVDASVRRGREIVEDYAKRGVSQDRILIKLASTWEGIRAAELLQRDGVDCNLTLLFSMAQAVAAADAGAFLISPFVGRITDWYKKHDGVDGYSPETDPGVASVKRIYSHYKSNGIQTIVMGASFRTTDQIKALAGCDNLTIAPKLLDALDRDNARLPRALSSDTADVGALIEMDEKSFRWEMNEDAMATEKLAEGIRNFHADHCKLIRMLTGKLLDGQHQAFIAPQEV